MYRQHYPNDPGMHNTPEVYTRASPQRGAHRGAPSLWERIKRSLLAIVVGAVILTVATGLIFWNEGRSVQTAKSLEEGLKAVRSLKSSEVIFDENNGKLVHLSGPLETKKLLADETYGVTVSAAKLRRRVEMYQWVETESKREVHDGESLTEEVSYSYSEQWRSDLIRSTSFNNRLHVNPDKIPIEAQLYVADNVQVGSFGLSNSLIEKITNFRELSVSEPGPPVAGVQVYRGYIYHGVEPTLPQIGDVRVMFDYAGLSSNSSHLGHPDKVSILGRQSARTLQPFETVAGDQLELLYPGEHSAEYMIGREHLSNTLVLWALRFVGWLLMFIAFGCLASFLVTIVAWVPVLGELVALGAVALSMVLSVSLSLTVIAVSWIWYRPYLGLFILVVAALPFVISHLRRQPPPRSYRPL